MAWKEKNKGLKAAIVNALAISESSPDVLYTAVLDDALFIGTKKGKKWKRVTGKIKTTEAFRFEPDLYGCESITGLFINPKKYNYLTILAGG